jgi:hypothetical protein
MTIQIDSYKNDYLQKRNKNGLQIWYIMALNYLQKVGTKYGGGCTFKERKKHWGFDLCYSHSTSWLGGRGKDIIVSNPIQQLQ